MYPIPSLNWANENKIKLEKMHVRKQNLEVLGIVRKTRKLYNLQQTKNRLVSTFVKFKCTKRGKFWHLRYVDAVEEIIFEGSISDKATPLGSADQREESEWKAIRSSQAKKASTKSSTLMGKHEYFGVKKIKRQNFSMFLF